eukprot:Gb_28637 [translate_table: standard]
MEELGSYGAFGQFMKGGPCKRRFELWAECVQDAHNSGADAVDTCGQMTALLQVCLEMNPDYYGHMMHFHTLVHNHNARKSSQTKH